MKTLFHRLLSVVPWWRRGADLREEIETHRSLRQDALERDGLGADDAAHASRRAIGNITLAIEEGRDAGYRARPTSSGRTSASPSVVCARTPASLSSLSPLWRWASA